MVRCIQGKRLPAEGAVYPAGIAGAVSRGLVVDLDGERIVVYHFEKDEIPTIYGAEEEIPVGIYNGELKISMKELFELVRDVVK